MPHSTLLVLYQAVPLPCQKPYSTSAPQPAVPPLPPRTVPIHPALLSSPQSPAPRGRLTRPLPHCARPHGAPRFFPSSPGSLYASPALEGVTIQGCLCDTVRGHLCLPPFPVTVKHIEWGKFFPLFLDKRKKNKKKSGKWAKPLVTGASAKSRAEAAGQDRASGTASTRGSSTTPASILPPCS